MTTTEQLAHAQEAIRQLAGWVIELDRDPGPPEEYITGADTIAAVTGSDPDEVRQAWAQADVWMRRAKRAEAELAQARGVHSLSGSANCPACSRDAAERAYRVWVDDDAGHARLEAAVITAGCVALLAAFHFTNGWLAYLAAACFFAAHISLGHHDEEVDHIEQRAAADRALRNEYPE